MSHPRLIDLLRQHFPNVAINGPLGSLTVDSFAEWDSLAHFNFLMLVEENYGVRFSVDEMSELKGLEQIARALANKGVTAT